MAERRELLVAEQRDPQTDEQRIFAWGIWAGYEVVASAMLESKPTIAMLNGVGFQVTINFKDRAVDAEIGL